MSRVSDTHGQNAERIATLPPDSAIIILGDSGFNFYLNKTDEKNKQQVNDMGHLVYCVRGNHEERPENLLDTITRFDEEVDGPVYMQEKYPNIRYLIDGESYLFDAYSALIIGGAYSVDKYYRLSRWHNGQNSWCGWFKDEQLSDSEKACIAGRIKGRHYNLVLTHTCPRSFQPIDLFLSKVDQSTVDNSMEDWMESIKDTFSWDLWFFGHYHEDRLVRPNVRMFYRDVKNLDDMVKLKNDCS